MDMENKEIIELMNANGVTRDIARLLIALRTEKDLTTKDITERTGIAQPNVSIAVAWAYKREWVSLEICREARAGRPQYRYALSKDFAEIVREIADDRAQEIAGMMADLKALKAVV